VLGAAMQRVTDDLAVRGGPSVVMAHAFVTGGATSDSERDISVGGVSAVHPEVFAGADYVALGHLHGRQQVAEGVRYSGSPVALSFSEVNHTKGSWLVDISDAGVSVTGVEAPVAKPLAVLRGELDDLLRDPRHAAAEKSWCQITLTDAVRPLGAMDRLRQRFPDALVVQFDPQGAVVTPTSYAAKVRERDDLDLCCDFLAHVRGGAAASAPERALLAEAVEGARGSRSERDDEGRAEAGRAREERADTGAGRGAA
jgi:exonuclease SbcD